MLYLGIDPDLHDLAIGGWDDRLGPVLARTLHVPRRRGVGGVTAVVEMVSALDEFTMPDLQVSRVAVEAQQLRARGGRMHKRPEDIVILGNVAGAALLWSIREFPGAQVYFPNPSQWKGSVPKAVMQARLYDELGWGYEMVGAGKDYARPLRPVGLPHVSAGQWKHIGDALLLARWASRQYPGARA